MFLTPFVGFSILIHVSLILFYKIFKLKPRDFASDRERARRRKERITYGFSLTIMASIFGIALVSAGALVVRSLRDKHSTSSLISQEYTQLSIYFQTRSAASRPLNAVAMEVNKALAIEKPAAPIIDCQLRFTQLASQYRNSLIYYLEAKGLTNSYPERKELAKWYGIQNYYGSSEQNLALLKFTLIKMNELPPSGSPLCK